MNKLEENIFIQEICQRLDASIAHLDPSISARLDSARQTALYGNMQAGIEDEDLLAEKVRRELNDNTAVTEEIEARLDQIRQQAMARLGTADSRTAPSMLANIRNWFDARFTAFGVSVPASMLATACVLVTVVSIFYVSFPPAGSLSLEDEISLLASAEDIELYENLEFYLWLAENESLNL